MSNLEENARLCHELEEARDQVERLVAEKIGISRQRDEIRQQYNIVMGQNLELRVENKNLKTVAASVRAARGTV